MINEGEKKTIRYNVGGHIFEVSHDVVNRHPTTILAKTASEFLQNGSAAEIFIDGNAERFSHVLDYLRSGRTILPITVPKATFMQDLNYYGFQNIDPNNIDAVTAPVNALDQVVKMEENYKEDLKRRDAELATLQLKRNCAIVAHECFRCYIQNGILAFRLQAAADSEVERCFSKLNVDFLNEMLATYGLVYVSHKKSSYGYVNLELGKLLAK